MEVKTIHEGGNNAQLHRLAGPLDYGTLTLEARDDGDVRPLGLVRARSSGTRASAPTARSCCSPRTASPSGRASSCGAACPVKLKAPALNAKDGMVAIEELQLVYESLTARSVPGGRPVPEPPRPGARRAARARRRLREPINESKWVKVQFNPETLKVTFANQIAQGSGRGDQRGSPARQFVGAGTTKLALQLWFDVTAYANGGAAPADDVRELTQRVAYFITPKPIDARERRRRGRRERWRRRLEQQPQFAPPGGAVRLGHLPVRRDHGAARGDARVLVARRAAAARERLAGVSQQKITFAFNAGTASAHRRVRRPGATPGTRPLAQAAPARPCQDSRPRPAPAARGSRSRPPTASRTRCGSRAAQLVDLAARTARGG